MHLQRKYLHESLRNFAVPSNIFSVKIGRRPPTKHWQHPFLVQHGGVPR